MEVIAAQQDPDQCPKSISSFAKTLTVRVAVEFASGRDNLSKTLLRKGLVQPLMFLLHAAWLNEVRSPGGRPSVSQVNFMLGGSTTFILTLASAMTGSSTSESYGSFHTFHRSSVLSPWFPPRLWFCFGLVFVCFCFCFCLFSLFLMETKGPLVRPRAKKIFWQPSKRLQKASLGDERSFSFNLQVRGSTKLNK